jgi:hypothetical protein
MSTVMGAGSQVGSFLSDSQAYYDSIGDTQRSGEIQQLIDANKANDLVARVKSGEATIEELESVLGSGKDKPKKLDDMSKEELDAYAKENDIELEEIEKTLTPEETGEEVVSEEEIEEEEKPKTKDPEENTLTLEEEVVEEPITEPDTISEEEIEELEEIENTPEEDRTPEQKKIASKRQVTESQKKVSKISKALKKIVPGVDFVLHNTEESYNNSSESDVSDSRGYRDGKNIHINVSESLDNTTFHEAIHPVLDAVFEKSPEVYNKLVKSMKSDPDFKDYMDNATADYTGENTQVNEALTEMMSDVASGKFNEGSTVYEKVKDFVKEVLTKLNLRASDFNIDLSKEVDVRQFAETIGKALAKGKEITFEKEVKLIQEKISDSIKKGLNTTKALSSVITESSDNLYEDVNGSKEITKEGVKKANEKANKNVDEFYDKVKNQISEKALNVYETINKTSKITRDGLLKASIKSKEFLKELSRNLDIASQKIYDSYKKSINYLKAASIGAGMILAADQAVIPSIEGYNKMGTEGAVYEVIKSNKWAVDALEGTELGNTLKSALGRLEFKSGDVVGGESVTIKEANEGSGVVKSVEDISPEDNVSPEVRKFIAKNTTFKISDKKIPLYRSGKRVGETAHIQNQFPADSGFIYSASPTVGSVKNKPFSADGSAVAQFQLDGSVSDEQTYEGNESDYTKGVPGHYMHKNNDAILKVSKQRNDYVPVFEKLGDNKVRVKYKRFNELEKGERIMSPLRQFKFSDIAWGQETQASDFAKGMKALPLNKGVKYPYPGKKGGNQTDIIFGSTYKNPKTGKISKGSDRYGLYEGIGAVFIFKDNNNITWVREFNGSANQVAAKGREIIKQFNIKPEDLTVGYHDVGSYSARPLAKKGKVSTDSYTGKNEYNKKPETGGALYYPPTEVNFQKKGKTELQNKADTLADKSKKEYDKQKNSGKNTEEAAKETFRKVFKNTAWFNKLSKEDQASVEADFNNRLVETFENPNPAKNQKGKPPKPKDTSDKVVTTKMKQLKEKWKNQDKGITEGKREALKTVKESQAEFQKDLNEVTKYLSESKRKRAELLLRNVKDQKTLGEARTKLDELVSDKTKYVTAKESEIDEQLKKAEKAAEKNLTVEQRKRLKEIAKELKGRIKGKVNLRTAVQLTRKLAGLDPFNVEKVAEFRDFVETVLDKSETEGAKSRVESKLKSAIKALRKYKGERDVLARELKEVDYSKVKDKKLYEEVVDALLDSAKKKVDIKEDSVSIKDVDIRKAISKLKQEQQGYLEEKFQESGYSEIMTYKEYKEMISNDNQKTEEEIADKLAEDKEKRKAIFEGTKKRLNEVKPTGSLKQRNALAKLKQLINQDGFYENMGDKNIADLFQAVEEMYNLDSAAGLSKIQAEISGIQKGINLKKYSDSKGGIFSKTGSAVWKGYLNTNWDNFASAVSKKLKYAQEFTAELFAEWDVAQARADTRSAEISNTIDSMMGETRAYSKAISDKGNQKIGVVSDLLMYDEGSTTEEIQEDFENKIKSVEEAIKREESIMKESWDYGHDYLAARRRKIALEEALDVVDKFNTREELQNAVDNGEVLTDKELKLYNEVKRIGTEIREEFEEASYLHSGKKIKRVVNYVPTQARSLNKKSEVEASKTGTGLSTNLTGRSKTKVSSRNITDKNYDFSSVAKSGLTEVIVDIETLPSKLELKSLINSNAFNDLFESGKESPLRKEVVKYINGIADARRNMTASDTIKRARLAGVLDNFFKSTIALPLKHSFQVINQTVPIALQTLNDVGIKGVSQAVSALTSSDPDVKARLDDVFSRSQSKNRTAMGDAQIDKSTAPIEKILRNAYSPEGRGNVASRTYQKLVSDVLKNSDYWIAKVSFVAAYMKELKRAGVDFLDAPIDNKIISKADTITNQINNASDFTKTKQGINSDKANKTIKNLLLLYKSFVQNQAVVFYSNVPKAARGEVDALRRITGQLIGLYTFQALSRGTASLLGDAVGELFGLDDEELMISGLTSDQARKKFKKEGLQKERENVLGDIGAATLSDLVTGWMPNILDGVAKYFINKSVSSVTVSDDDRLELKALGLTEEEFLDNYKNEFPGASGVLHRYATGMKQSYEIINNPNVPSSYKNIAYTYITAVLMREGLTVKGVSSKLSKVSRASKQLEKLVNSKQK